jgi:hypothetical protein
MKPLLKPLLVNEDNHSRVMQVKAKQKLRTVNDTIGTLLDTFEMGDNK